MARRVCIFGFEAGAALDGAASDGNFTFDSGAARTGGFGGKIVAASGTNSTFQVFQNVATGFDVIFYRFYMRISSAPGSDRRIFRTGNGLSSIYVKLMSTRALRLEHGTGGTIGTSSAILSTNTWYRVEVGADKAGNMLSLRIDGAVEVDWTAIGGGGTLTTDSSFYFGAIDTVAATMTVHFDDICSDTEDWPGPGRIERIDPDTLASDNANWTLGAGASKLAAISESPAAPDGDTSYLLQPANTTDEIIFSFEDCPTASVVPRGVCGWIYGKSNGVQIINRAVNASSYVTGATVIVSFSGSYTWQQFPVGASTIGNGFSNSLLAGQWSNDEVSQIHVGLRASSGAGSCRISNFFLEVEYDDRAEAIVDTSRMYVAGFEAQVGTENLWQINTSVTGSATASNVRAKHGSQSLRINPGNGANGYWAAAIYAVNNGGVRRGSTSFWMYVNARQTSGIIDIWSEIENTTKVLGVAMDSSGGIAMFSNGADGSFTAANTIPTGQWVFVQIVYRRASASAASDGMLTVWIDGVKKLDSNTVTIASVAGNASLRYGTVRNASGGCDIHYDLIIIDGGRSLPGSDHLLATLYPTGAGGLTEAGFTANTGTKPNAVDDTGTNDGDTTYMLTDGTSGHNESHAMDDTPSGTQKVLGAFIFAYHKRDGASSGIINIGLINNTGAITANDYSSATSTGAAYAVVGMMVKISRRRGHWTKTLIDAAEFYYREGSANKSRITQAGMVVEYTLSNAHGNRNSSMVQMVG